MHPAPDQHRTPDLALAAVARRQHGVWTTAQAYRAGLSRSMIRTRVSTGRWIRLDRAVYADVSSLPTWQRQVTAAVLAEPWAAASHRAAAGLRRLEGFPRRRIEITVRPGANARGRLALVHRGIDVEVDVVEGIRCTSLAQTFVDLAQVVPVEQITPALDAVAAARPIDLDAVRNRYAALAPRGGRNLRPLRAALERYGDGAAPSSSELERVLRTVLDHPAIPPVSWEAPFPGREAGSQRVDAMIRSGAS
jgi:hypothetical protein